MLLINRSRRRAAVIPLWPAWGVVLVLPAIVVKAAPSIVFLLVLLLAVGLSEIRWVERRGDLLVVHRIGGAARVRADAAAFGFRVSNTARAVIEVYVTDGSERHAVVNHVALGTRRAEQSVCKLESVFIDGAPSDDRRGAAVVDADRAAIAQVQSRIAAYYTSPSWRRAGYWILGLLLVYLLAIAVMGWVTRTVPN